MSEYVRRERAARQRARELAIQAKEQTKLAVQAQARVQVEAYESQIEVLISLHREVGRDWNWQKIAAALPPPPPVDSNQHEMKARQNALIRTNLDPKGLEAALEAARAQDRSESLARRKGYEAQLREWDKMTKLARRIIAHDRTAYIEALGEFSPLAELAELGTNMDFTIHTPTLIECQLTMKDTSVIPLESKSLTTSGKLSVKATPRSRFHEIYQDYVCSGILRAARELFAMLPVETVIATATCTVFDPATGNSADQPVLSVILPRTKMQQFQWDLLDPSDAIERLAYRGDFKASRKSGAFLPIMPFSAANAAGQSHADTGFAHALSEVVSLRSTLTTELAAISHQ